MLNHMVFISKHSDINFGVMGLAFRRRIAERIAAPLKRVGIETPILDEVPRKAEVLHEEFFELVGGGRIAEAVEVGEVGGRIAERIRVPVFAHGKAYGETAGLWYKVSFPRRIGNPSVVCVGEARTTDFRKREIEKIPDLTIGKTSPIPLIEKIAIPPIDITFTRPYLTVLTVNDFIDGIKRFLGDWGVFNWIRDAIAWAYGHVEYWAYTILWKRYAESVNKMLDDIYKIFDSMRKGLSDMVRLTNDRLEALRVAINNCIASINAGMEGLRTGTNTRVETLRTKVNEITGDIIPALYDACGIPLGMALTPLHIRNVSEFGFEFQSFGQTTCYWIAIGSRV